jgi:D-alanyl-D-alanine carboxypeptidase
VAGDSPGRAEQQESSGETTADTAGGAAGAADPRLAIATVVAGAAEDPAAEDSAVEDSAAAGGSAESGERSELNESDESDESDEPDAPDEADGSRESGEHRESRESGESGESDESGELNGSVKSAAGGEGDEVGPADAADSESGAEDVADSGSSAEPADSASPVGGGDATGPGSAEEGTERAEDGAGAPEAPEPPSAPPAPPTRPAAPPAVPLTAERPATPRTPTVESKPPAAAVPSSAPPMPPLPPPPPPPALPGAAPKSQAVAEFGTGRPAERERTKQQPLPSAFPTAPEEPLKLLAKLTNTPAPPDTLLRTSVRRVKIWSPLVVVLVIVFCVVQAVRPLPAPTLALTAPASYTFGGAKPSVPWPAEGQAALEVQGLGSMGTYGAQKPEPIASVAKIMTAYLVLRDHPMKAGSTGAQLTVDQQAAADFKLGAEGESVVKVTNGQRITEYEALEDIMLASANNIARMLARWDAGSEAAFVKKMNATAKRFGMDHTTYTDPSGLTATTVSTATDQVKLAEKAMAIPVFRQVVAEPSYRTASGDTYDNWNHLVGTNNVVGVKTGTSTAAGGNLVFAAYKQVGGTTQLIIGAVLGQYKPSILDTVTAASLQLVLTAQQSLTSSQVIRKGDVVGYVDDGLGGRTPVVATRDVQAVGWPGVKVPIALSTTGVPHSAKAGAKVGTLTVGSGPGQVRIPVALKSALNEPGFGAKLGHF